VSKKEGNWWRKGISLWRREVHVARLQFALGWSCQYLADGAELVLPNKRYHHLIIHTLK
jgi:hypothetical protein